ncbi:MAG: xylose isomerase [Candidatus Nephrothrix sp. EaCA]|nr:MAG: xylose isomerase [Candidatus Nephrothrix sp. EaCA]
MKKINRRSFIAQSTMGMGALALSQWPLAAEADDAKNKQPLGFQTYPFREAISKDFSGTLKKVAAMGYQVVEMCYPSGYAKAGFGNLVNVKASEILRIIKDAGLSCPSCHFPMQDLTGDKFAKSMEFAHQLKLKQIVCPGLDTPGKSIADYKEASSRLNKIAERIKKEGMTTGLHNHTGEFATLDGELIYDAIMEELDGNLVKMQFQTEVIFLGYKASDYFKKYPGRFISAHLSDWNADKQSVPIGKGLIDWKEFFETAKIGGVKHFFVEIEVKQEHFKESTEYLRGLLG